MSNFKFITLACYLLTTTALFFPSNNNALAQTKNKSYDDVQQISYTFPTRFGKLEFIKDDGQLGTPASVIKLNGNTLLKEGSPKDQNAYRPSLMIVDNGEQQASKQEPSYGNALTYRLILSEGEDGNCIKQFVILDFTGNKPYVSERFGYNPENTACLEFIKAKWGKKESYITLDGPLKYIYYTGEKIFGPL